MQYALVDDVDDVAFGFRRELRGKIAGEKSGRFGMDGKVRVPKAFGQIGDRVLLEHRSVVDEEGERTKGPCCGGNESGPLPAVGEIGPGEGSVGARRPYPSDSGLRLVGRGAVVDDDFPAVRREALGDGRADAVGGSGNEGNAARRCGGF